MRPGIRQRQAVRPANAITKRAIMVRYQTSPTCRLSDESPSPHRVSEIIRDAGLLSAAKALPVEADDCSAPRGAFVARSC